MTEPPRTHRPGYVSVNLDDTLPPIEFEHEGECITDEDYELESE